MSRMSNLHQEITDRIMDHVRYGNGPFQFDDWAKELNVPIEYIYSVYGDIVEDLMEEAQPDSVQEILERES